MSQVLSNIVDQMMQNVSDMKSSVIDGGYKWIEPHIEHSDAFWVVDSREVIIDDTDYHMWEDSEVEYGKLDDVDYVYLWKWLIQE